MKRKYDLYFKDILESIEKIESYTGDEDYASFKTNQMVLDAVLRNFEVIGEAVSQIPDEVKKKYSQVPWQDVKDFRNVVIHKYWTVDTEIAWDIIQNRLPPLKRQMQDIYKETKTSR